MQNNLLTCFFAIPENKANCIIDATRNFFASENFEITMKNFQEMWVLYFSKTLKNLAYAQLREVRTNQVISAHANFSRTHTQKFLVAFRNENLFVML
jgi:hypothetical protein